MTFGLLTEGQPAVVTSLSLGQAKSALFLSQKTVRNYVSGILDKLQVADRAEARLARAAGIGTGDTHE